MLKLSFFATSTLTPAVSLSLPELRVAGGSVSTADGLTEIATFSGGEWWHRGVGYPVVTVTGGACIVFGFARESPVVSDPLEHFQLAGPVLSADGVAIAKFNEHQNTWQGTLKSMWWVSIRIIGVDQQVSFPYVRHPVSLYKEE